MTHRFIIPIALLAALMSGCAKNNQAQLDRPSPTDSIGEGTIENKPLSADTRFAAGQLAEIRGEYKPALSQYREALRIEPGHVRALYRLACLNAQLKNWPESIAAWRRYLKATDNSATGYSNLAYAEELAGNPAAAEIDYKAGILKEPTNEACRVNYGLMLARHGRVGEAVLQLQTVLTPAEVHFNIATVYELEHRPEMAKLEYKQALTLDPTLKDARDKLASMGDLLDEE